MASQAEAAHSSVDRANRLLVAAVYIFLGTMTVLVALGVAFALTMVAETRDAADGVADLVRRQDAADDREAAETRQALVTRNTIIDDAIGRISTSLAKGIAEHDANVHADLEELLRRLRPARTPATLPARTPITVAPVRPTAPPATASSTTTAPPPPATTTTTRPPTTTTTCPRLPNGRCRP